MSGIIEWGDLSFPERVIIRSKSTKSFLNFTRIWFELIQAIGCWLTGITA
jgi:hypothetical protein